MHGKNYSIGINSMKVFREEWSRTSSGFFPLFVTSVVVVWGIILTRGRDFLLQTDVLDESSLELIKYQVQDGRSLLFYVLKERVFVVPMIFLMSTTYLTALFSYGVIIWYGAGVGAVLGVAMLRYGLKGIFLVLAAGIPQYLLYIPVMVVAFKLSLKQRQPNKKFWVQFLVLELVVIIGCVLESYVNLYLIEKFIKSFIL